MLSRTYFIYAIRQPDCRAFSTKATPSMLAVLNQLHDATRKKDKVKPAVLARGASRFYELGEHSLKYACIGGMAPADCKRLRTEYPSSEDLEMNFHDYRDINVDILRCPELLARKIVGLFPVVDIRKSRLKVIRLHSRRPDKKLADDQCLNAANRITQRLMENGVFSLYSGIKDVRRPLLFHLDNSYFQLSDDDLRGLHAAVTKSHGCVQINHLNIDDIGVIYTDDHRDIDTLKKYIENYVLRNNKFRSHGT